MKKTPLIFIHGFRGTGQGLAWLAKQFDQKKYQVFTPTLPPFGQPAKTLSIYDPDHYAKFIADYIQKNQLKKPVLIGHSMGSVIAAATAEKYPDLIAKKLILLAPLSVKPSAIIANLQPLVTIFPNKIIGYLTTQYMIIDRSNLPKILEITYECGEYFGKKADLKAATKFSASHCITDFQIQKDLLLLAGENDRLISKKATQSAAVKLHGQATFLKNTGHLLNYEKPAATARAITAFLES